MSDELWGDKPESTDQEGHSSQPPPESSEQRKQKKKESREWRLIEKLIMGLNAEQRRSRRWGIFFKSLTFIYLFAALIIFIPDGWMPSSKDDSGQHTALVDISGPIAADEDANADTIVGSLREAFKDPGTVGVILRINSPGGSPVQSGYVYDEIVRLKGEYPNTKVYSVIGDIGASGGYYIAAAADEIYADKASLVGSIGVISSSFGFVDVLKKLGVERRVVTAGEHKAFLDPFTPLKDSEKEFWKGVLDTTHKQFISQVKKGRGDRLKDDPQLFSGLIWTGEQAKELGLIDGLGSPGYVARDVIGEKNIVDFTQSQSPLEQVIDRFSASFARTLAVELGWKDSPIRY
ncbi:MAG: signal peptide peptidase SppA [Motiliproteus sp.]|nr:signal peptide peptidase SppA [Motiliproteus sp.]MCW9052964.1 signal peptide peptidase SppA [Motiliproteus sp.]